MKKVITTLAFAAMVAQAHATPLSDVVSKIASDLNIQIVDGREHHTRNRHIERRRVDSRKHVVRHQNKHTAAKKNLSHNKAKLRNFHSLSEYKKVSRHGSSYKKNLGHHTRGSSSRHIAHNGSRKLGNYVGNGWYSDDDGYYNEEWEDSSRVANKWKKRHRHTGRAYRHYRRYWYLTYLYEGSYFHDKHGYLYGYFDRNGFMFDGWFYNYDYSYTYQDRLHGKGLFEHRYYRPEPSWRERNRRRYAF